MQEAVDDWAYFVGMTELTLCAEDEFGCHVPDEALVGVDTVDAFCVVLAGLLPDRVTPASLEAQVIAWAREVSGRSVASSTSLRVAMCGRYLGSRWDVSERPDSGG